MTEREKIAHLLRRLGLGAGEAELRAYEPLGVEGTAGRLLEYQSIDEGFPVTPYEICFEDGKDEVYVDSFRPALYWGLRTVMTQRPLEQRLTLFWHNHLVVGGDKVEFGPALNSYLETLRVFGPGDFKTLLTLISIDAAMLRYLDGDKNAKGAPNENFAREVMELFTMGIGHYTEQDVKEAARSFTGWGLRYLIYEDGGEKVQQHIKDAMAKGQPMIVSCFSPALHDDGPKTVLGKTANYDTGSLIADLAQRPETALYLGTKFFEHFAYRNPSEVVKSHMATKFKATNGNALAMLKEIVTMDEFWSPQCVRKQVKSPFDFVVPIARQMNLATYLRSVYKPTTPTTPLAKPFRDVGGLVYLMMSQQGMGLLFPPSVKGWDWGEHWITPNAMTERIKMADTIFGVNQPDKGLAGYIGMELMSKKPSTDADVVDGFFAKFDIELPDNKRSLVVEAFQKAGGMAALGKPETASPALAAIGRLSWGSPEFQFC
jgi:uncharacterized protein (DUF1800 family)